MSTNFERPTRRQILARVQADIEGELDGVSAQVRRRPEFAHAVAIALTADSLHGHLAWVAEQIIVDQAAERFLLRWADLFGLSRKPATAATGTITVTGTGGTLPATTEWIRVADGLSFTTDADHTISTTASVAITASPGFEGVAGNLAAGATLQLVSPISGLNSEAVVEAPGLADGAEIESLPDLLERLLDRIQRPPLGGAPGDYVAWALEVPGVTRAWEYQGTDGVGNPGLGKVAVAFVLDGETDIIPDSDKVDEVQEYLDARSPAEPIAFALTSVPLALTIDLGANDTTDIRDAVKAEVKDMLSRDAAPAGTVFLSRINEAISTAAGEVSHNLVSPVADVTVAFGEISTYVDPTFV